MNISPFLRFLTALWVTALCGTLQAKPNHPPLDAEKLGQIDVKVSEAMKRDNVPGLALAIVQNGQPLLAKTWGRAHLEHPIAVTPQSVFKLASVSKHMIAAGILLLAQEGKLSIDDPAAKYLANTPDTWKGITLRHLMGHSAGIVREGPAFDPYKPASDREVVASAYAKPLEFPTGTKLLYCNVCYFALAEIISAVSGQPWPVFMQSRLFSPAGMKATRVTTTQELVPLRVYGYEVKRGALVPAEDYIAVRPSGAFLSNLEDMIAWEAFLLSGKVLTPKSITDMSTPVHLNDGSIGPFGAGGKSSYGFGFEISRLEGRARIHHGGALPGFRTHFGRYPESGMAIIVLANGPLRAGALEEAIAKIVVPAATADKNH